MANFLFGLRDASVPMVEQVVAQRAYTRREWLLTGALAFVAGLIIGEIGLLSSLSSFLSGS